jgi:hypothetical protein
MSEAGSRRQSRGTSGGSTAGSRKRARAGRDSSAEGASALESGGGGASPVERSLGVTGNLNYFGLPVVRQEASVDSLDGLAFRLKRLAQASTRAQCSGRPRKGDVGIMDTARGSGTNRSATRGRGSPQRKLVVSRRHAGSYDSPTARACGLDREATHTGGEAGCRRRSDGKRFPRPRVGGFKGCPY